jgi:ASC-1-like (ASCH) protein
VRRKKTHEYKKGDLVIYKTHRDEYSVPDELVALVVKDARPYDSFAHVLCDGRPMFVHVNSLKRVPDANL